MTSKVIGVKIQVALQIFLHFVKSKFINLMTQVHTSGFHGFHELLKINMLVYQQTCYQTDVIKVFYASPVCVVVFFCPRLNTFLLQVLQRATCLLKIMRIMKTQIMIQYSTSEDIHLKLWSDHPSIPLLQL